MNIENPLSSFLVGLLVTLPGLWWTARAFSFRVCSDYHAAQILTPGFTVILWLLAVHLAGLATHSFSNGLLIGTLIPAAYGYAYARRLMTTKTVTTQIFPWQLIWVAGICTIVILPAVIFWDFHDRNWHFAVTTQIVNDIYPPRDFTFANLQLSYHHGIDTLFAMVIALTRLRMDFTIDLVTVLTWWYTLVLFGLLSTRLFGERAGLLGILLGGFAGGFPWWLETTAYVEAMNAYKVGDQFLNPPFASYFFQYPWTLGTPLLLIILFLFEEFYQREQRRLEVIYAFMLSFAVLSFSNMTLFLTLSVSTLVSSVLAYLQAHSTGKGNRLMLLLPIAIAATLIITPLFGGMLPFLFHLGQGGGASIIFADQGIAGNCLTNLQWNLAGFGFLLPLGIVGLLLIKSSSRWLFAFMVVGSLFTVNLFKYERTWDIVKFATVAQIILAIASVGVLVWLLKRTRLSFKFLAGLLGGVIIAAGLTFHLPFWLNDARGIWLEQALWRTPSVLTPAEEQAISWVRHRISEGEIVICPMTLFFGCMSLGGFPFLYHPSLPWTLGFPLEKIAQRQNLFSPNLLPVDVKPYLNEGVRWAILPAGAEPWETVVHTWVKEGSAKEVVTFEAVTVFQVGK